MRHHKSVNQVLHRTMVTTSPICSPASREPFVPASPSRWFGPASPHLSSSASLHLAEGYFQTMASIAWPSSPAGPHVDSNSPGRPRSHSEGAVFQNSFDYSVPYAEHGGKNGADLALDLLGARDAPFDSEGRLRVPTHIGSYLAYPHIPVSLGGDSKRQVSKAARRSFLKLGIPEDDTIDGIEELVALSASIESPDETAPDEVHVDDSELVPRIVGELVEDNVVPEEYADLPPEEIAKMFHINPRSTPKRKPKEHSITHATNAEGRTIIEHATLQQVVKAFASDAQGTFIASDSAPFSGEDPPTLQPLQCPFDCLL